MDIFSLRSGCQNVPLMSQRGGGGVAINFFPRFFCLGDTCELLQLLVSLRGLTRTRCFFSRKHVSHRRCTTPVLISNKGGSIQALYPENTSKIPKDVHFASYLQIRAFQLDDRTKVYDHLCPSLQKLYFWHIKDVFIFGHHIAVAFFADMQQYFVWGATFGCEYPGSI